MPGQPGLRDPSERVSPRAKAMWTVEALLDGVFLVAVYVGLGIAFDPVPFTWWAAALVAAASLAFVVVMPRWRYAVHRWEVSETAVYTQTGWLTIERRIAPMSRIQTVDYNQGVFSRLFGLATVTVTTASAAGALQIAALDQVLARELVERLSRRADAVAGDAT